MEMEDESKIEFHYDEIEFLLEQEEKYEHWLQGIASKYEKEIGQLSYIFCDDEKILEINKAYLQHDYYTDIISFPYQLEPISGDIYISVDTVKSNAEKFEIAFDQELLRVMSHGLLHFIGFDDHSEEDIAEMRNAENEAIAVWA